MTQITGKRLNEETLLFLGTGAIAQKGCLFSKAFGMKVIGVSKSGKMLNNLMKFIQLKS